jgi:hypothetical protein
MFTRFGFFLILLFVIASCQKGEEDPLFSLVTRKSRITGTWDVKIGASNTQEFSTKFADDQIEYNYGDTLIYSRSLDWQLSFQRDGVYTETKIEEIPEDLIQGTQAYTLTETETGIWEFTGGNESPSKSELLLMTTEIRRSRSDQGSNISLVTYDNPSSGKVFDIVQLSSKDLKLSVNETQSFGGGQITESASLELVKQ